MKKLFSLILVLSLVISLAACGGAKQTSDEPTSKPAEKEQPQATEEIVPEEGAELVVWESEGEIGEWMKFVGEEFTKKYGVPVSYEAVGHTDAPGKLQTDGPAGLGADVFAAPHDHLGSLISAGLVLENFWPEEYQGAYMDAAITGTTLDGMLYGYPTAIETYALFYNKDLVTKVPETWEDVIAQSKEFNDVDAADLTDRKYGFMMQVDNFYFVYSLIGGYGGYVFGDNNTNPNDLGLNNDGAVNAETLLQRIHHEILPLTVEDLSYEVKQSFFNEGKLLFNVDGPWAVAGHREAGVNFGIAPLPVLDNGQHPTSFSGIRALYVNAYTQYPDAASLFAKFASSEEMLLKFFEQTGMLPPRTALLSNPTITSDEISAGFLNQAQYAVPMPNIPQMTSVWGPMASALTTIWNDDTDPKQALDAAVQQIVDAIATQESNK